MHVLFIINRKADCRDQEGHQLWVVALRSVSSFWVGGNVFAFKLLVRKHNKFRNKYIELHKCTNICILTCMYLFAIERNIGVSSSLYPFTYQRCSFMQCLCLDKHFSGTDNSIVNTIHSITSLSIAQVKGKGNQLDKWVK